MPEGRRLVPVSGTALLAFGLTSPGPTKSYKLFSKASGILQFLKNDIKAEGASCFFFNMTEL